MRMEGYEARMRDKRIFTASFITAPVLNIFRGKGAPVTAKKLLPQDFPGWDADEDKIDHLHKFADEQERRRKHGES